jgi:hypothetical protein
MGGRHTMTIRVLVADDDLDVHELVDDILHINFKDVAIDRAMDHNGIRSKIRSMQKPYDIILLGDNGMKGYIEILYEECPALMKKTVMICPEGSEHIEKWGDITRINRPFSLDDFGEVLGKICAT